MNILKSLYGNMITEKCSKIRPLIECWLVFLKYVKYDIDQCQRG